MILPILENGLEAMGLGQSIPAEAAAQLDRYARLLLEKNQVMNLTAIKEPEQVARLPIPGRRRLEAIRTFGNSSTLSPPERWRSCEFCVNSASL